MPVAGRELNSVQTESLDCDMKPLPVKTVIDTDSIDT
jgi:hypothetical protein